MIITSIFKINVIFSAENWQKSQKSVDHKSDLGKTFGEFRRKYRVIETCIPT
jgi:hypothetical protein